jgi:hypothetical protein
MYILMEQIGMGRAQCSILFFDFRRHRSRGESKLPAARLKSS